MGRLGGLGPSADTSAKRKKQVVRLLTPQQSEVFGEISLKEMSKKQLSFAEKLFAPLICRLVYGESRSETRLCNVRVSLPADNRLDYV